MFDSLQIDTLLILLLLWTLALHIVSDRLIQRIRKLEDHNLKDYNGSQIADTNEKLNLLISILNDKDRAIYGEAYLKYMYEKQKKTFVR